MKKTLFTLALLFLTIATFERSIDANQIEIKASRHNYFDLSTIAIFDPETNPHGASIRYMSIDPNKHYTLVVGSSMLGTYYDEYFPLIETTMIVGSRSHDFSFSMLMEQNIVYYEFDSLDGTYLYFDYIPLQVHGYDIVIYEGTINDFVSFNPFIREQINYIEEGSIEVDYDNPLTITELKNKVRATYDNNDIEVEIIEDQYTNSNKKPGSYLISFVARHNQVTRLFHLNVNVVDKTAPVIKYSGLTTIGIDEKLSLTEIKNNITVSDNISNLTINDLVLKEDTYSSATTPGNYRIVFEVTDSSNNESTLTINLELKDQTGPKITGPAEIFIYSNDLPISNEDILALFTFYDSIDKENVTYSITQNNYQQQVIPNVYTVKIVAKDTSNNQTEVTLKIHVIDNSVPQFIIDDLVIITTVKSVLSESDIIAFIKESYLKQGQDIKDIKITFNEYTEKTDIKGSYYVYFTYTLNNITKTNKLKIEIHESEPEIPYYVYGVGVAVIICAGFIYFYSKKRKQKNF